MRKLATLATVLSGMLLLGGGGVYAAGQVARSNAIGEEAARNFAYVDAGILPEDANITSVEFDYEKGKFVYEVEFVANGIKYDYIIDSSNGRVLDKAYRALPNYGQNAGNNAAAQNQTTDPLQGNTAGTDIGVSKAKSIALEDAGVAEADVIFQKAKLERDNGRMIYDIEIYVAGKAEYDYEIDAYTGAILEKSVEALPAAQQSTTTKPAATVKPAATAKPAAAKTDIGVSKAKSIALNNAGVAAKNAVFQKAKLERDDGRMIYDIEFYVAGKAEYDYEIDAYTGAILERDIDAWEEDDD